MLSEAISFFVVFFVCCMIAVAYMIGRLDGHAKGFEKALDMIRRQDER